MFTSQGCFSIIVRNTLAVLGKCTDSYRKRAQERFAPLFSHPIAHFTPYYQLVHMAFAINHTFPHIENPAKREIGGKQNTIAGHGIAIWSGYWLASRLGDHAVVVTDTEYKPLQWTLLLLTSAARFVPFRSHFASALLSFSIFSTATSLLSLELIFVYISSLTSRLVTTLKHRRFEHYWPAPRKLCSKMKMAPLKPSAHAIGRITGFLRLTILKRLTTLTANNIRNSDF